MTAISIDGSATARYVVAWAAMFASAIGFGNDYERGVAACNAAKWNDAIAAFSAHLEDHPDDAKATASRGSAFVNRGGEGDVDRAATDAQTAMNLDSKCSLAYCCRGDVRFAKGEIDSAIADYAEAIRLDPERVASYGNRARALTEKGNFEAAIEDYDAIIRMAPESSAGYMGRAIVRLRKATLPSRMIDDGGAKRYGIPVRYIPDDEAAASIIMDCEKAIELDPNVPRARSVRVHAKMLHFAKIDEIAREFDIEAKEFFEYVKGNRPEGPSLSDDAPLWVLFMRLPYQGDNSKKLECDDVAQELDAAIDYDATDAIAYHLRGVLNLLKGEDDAAIRDLVQALHVNPKSVDSRYRLAEFYESKRRYYDALGCYATLVEQFPEHGPAKEELDRLTKLIRETWEKPAIKVTEVTLDSEMKSVVVKKGPPILMAPGTEKVVEDTIRVRHSTSISDKWSVGVEVKGMFYAWLVEIGAAVKGGIEHETERTFGTETETKRSVTVRATPGAPKVRVVWVDYYRTGKAKVELDGLTFELPFEFKEDFDLLTEAAE